MCTVANCTFRSCHGLALEEVDGGIMENIAINNMTHDGRRRVSDLHHARRPQSRAGVTTPSQDRNILISNVVATGVDPMSGIQITGIPEQPMEGVRLENIRLVFKGGGTKEDAARVPRNSAPVIPNPAGLG